MPGYRWMREEIVHQARLQEIGTARATTPRLNPVRHTIDVEIYLRRGFTEAEGRRVNSHIEESSTEAAVYKHVNSQEE